MNERDRRRIESLKLKTVENGCSKEEEASAKQLIKNIESRYPDEDKKYDKAREFVYKHKVVTKKCVHCGSTDIKQFVNRYNIYILGSEFYFCKDCLNETMYFIDGTSISCPSFRNLDRLKMHLSEAEIMVIYFTEKEKLKPIIKRSGLFSKVKFYANVFIYKIILWK